MTVGERIRQLRLERHFSQEQLAERLEVSRQAVTKWENGKSLPSMEKLLALCDLFGVPLGELTGTEASAPAARSGAGRLRALVILCVLSAFAAVWSVCRAFSERLPENVIGYADRATEIYVQGVPLLPVLLCLAALLLCAATGFLFWRTNKHKENTHR